MTTTTLSHQLVPRPRMRSRLSTYFGGRDRPNLRLRVPPLLGNMKLGATKCAVLSALIGIQIVATMISCVVPYRHSGAPGPRPHGPQADHLYRGQYGYQITKDAPPGLGHPQSRVPFRYWMEDLMHWSVMTTVPKFQQLLVLQGYMGGDCLIMLKNMPMDTKMQGAQVQLN